MNARQSPEPARLAALLATLAAAGTAAAHVDVLPVEIVRDQATQLTIRVPNERATPTPSRGR